MPDANAYGLRGFPVVSHTGEQENRELCRRRHSLSEDEDPGVAGHARRVSRDRSGGCRDSFRHAQGQNPPRLVSGRQ